MRLVPQGAIPKNLNIGVRLTPLGVPVEERAAVASTPTPTPCAHTCASLVAVGWTSTGGVASAVTGSAIPGEINVPIAMGGGPFTVQIYLAENNVQDHELLLCGRTPVWTFGGSLVNGVDYIVADMAASVWLFGMKGCDPPYSGNIIVNVQDPADEGADYCDPITLEFSGEGGGCGGDIPCCFTSGFGNPCAVGSINLGSAFPSYDITDTGANAGGSPLFWVITNVGDPVAVDPTITGDGTTYTISYDGVTDIFGARWTCVPYLDAELTMPYCDSPVIASGIS